MWLCSPSKVPSKFDSRLWLLQLFQPVSLAEGFHLKKRRKALNLASIAPRQAGCLEQNCWADSKHKFSIRYGGMLLPLSSQHQGKAQEALYIKPAGEQNRLRTCTEKLPLLQHWKLTEVTERNRVTVVGEIGGTRFVDPYHPASFISFETQGAICLFIAMCHHIYTENAIHCARTGLATPQSLIQFRKSCCSSCCINLSWKLWHSLKGHLWAQCYFRV